MASKTSLCPLGTETVSSYNGTCLSQHFQTMLGSVSLAFNRSIATNLFLLEQYSNILNKSMRIGTVAASTENGMQTVRLQWEASASCGTTKNCSHNVAKMHETIHRHQVLFKVFTDITHTISKSCVSFN